MPEPFGAGSPPEFFDDEPLSDDDPLFEDDPLFDDDPLSDDEPLSDADPLELVVCGAEVPFSDFGPDVLDAGSAGRESVR